MADYPPPPYRIKVVEPIEQISREQRKQSLEAADYNLFNLMAEQVYIDFLTDSGTGSMSQKQWAAMMMGDESYANARSFTRFQSAVQQFTGFSEIIPAHQGRAAENILFGHLLQDQENTMVISNQSFDTTVGHILYNKAEPVDIVIEEAKNPQLDLSFKGDMDTSKLKELLEEDKDRISVITLVLTNNAGGGQPVSMNNIRKVSQLANTYGIPFFLDIARIVENAYFIKTRDPNYQNWDLGNLVEEICTLSDGVWMSAKKDGYVNIGGFIAVKDPVLAAKLRERLILFEGFPTYGGMAGRDLEAIATGLKEVVQGTVVEHRVQQVTYLIESMEELGIPVVLPPGGHAAFIDAKQFLPHIPAHQFPAQALACELYLEGGIRSVEIGSLMFGRDIDGEFIPAKMELVRLAIPRRSYEKAHFDYVIDVIQRLYQRRDEIRGMEITDEPKLLRHFTCKLAPVADHKLDQNIDTKQ